MAMRRTLSTNDAAGTLLGLASSPIASPEMKPTEGGSSSGSSSRKGAPAALKRARELPFELGGGDELTTPDAAAAAAAAAGSSVDSTANALAAAAAAEEDAADAVERPKRPRASEEEQADTRLLSDAAVLLSCIGVAYALQSVLEQARRDLRPRRPRAPSAHPAFPRAQAVVGAEEGKDFSESVCQLLLAECRHVPALDDARVLRLCTLLGLPEHVTRGWQQRATHLQQCLEVVTAPPGGAPPPPPLTYEFAAVAGSVEAAVRQFGQQTVWCAVALLRRVLRGAHWPTSAPAADEVEARLASLAVSMMRQAVAAVGTADRDSVDA